MVFLKKWWQTSSGTLKGAVWMILAGACFAGLGVTIRLSAADIDILEVIFFRNFFNLILMLPWLWHIGWVGLRTQRLGLHALRSINGLVAMFFWFTAVTMLPLAEATSLGFTAPLFATMGAALFLSEDVRLRRWVAVGAGFLGTLIILRPGIEIISPGAVLMIVGAVFVAISFLLVKVLSRTEPPNTMVLYMSLLLTPVSAVPLIWVWEMPHGLVWLWLLGVGASATCGHLCFTRAMASADASAVLPYEYVRLIFVAIIAFFLFGEVPDLWTWLGSVVIFGSGVYIANREAAAFKNGRQMKLLAAQVSGKTSKP